MPDKKFVPTRVKVAVAPDMTGNEDSYSGLCECGFMTNGWPTDEIAAARITEHKREHKTGQLMTPLDEFRARHGLVAEASGNRAVFPEGAVEVDEESEE